MSANYINIIRQQAAVLPKIDRQTPFFIIGCSQNGVQLVRILSDKHDTIEVFDDRYAGQTIGQHTVKKFSVENRDISSTIVILTVDMTAEQQTNMLHQLKQMGFLACFGGHQFLQAYEASKFYADYKLYKSLNKDKEFDLKDDKLWPIPNEWHMPAASIDTGYFLQDIWGARKIYERQPSRHYDIGSMVAGFIAHLMAMNIPTTMIDIRPLETYGLEKLTFIQADATNLDGIADNSVESISALHSLEHFGLGRYGDPVDPDAHIKAFKSIQRVLKKGGDAYIGLPLGARCTVQFNAHRIYAPRYVVEAFNGLDLIEFSKTSSTGLIINAPLDLAQNISYGPVGLYHFKKQ
jgi:SAM-dependent methyltransferase